VKVSLLAGDQASHYSWDGMNCAVVSSREDKLGKIGMRLTNILGFLRCLEQSSKVWKNSREMNDGSRKKEKNDEVAICRMDTRTVSSWFGTGFRRGEDKKKQTIQEVAPLSTTEKVKKVPGDAPGKVKARNPLREGRSRRHGTECD